jgi:hypothetical protein
MLPSDSSGLPGNPVLVKTRTFKANNFVPELTGKISIFDLASGGVYLAFGITTGAVGSYPTFSPLPAETIKKAGIPSFDRKYIFCGTFRILS